MTIPLKKHGDLTSRGTVKLHTARRERHIQASPDEEGASSPDSQEDTEKTRVIRFEANLHGLAVRLTRSGTARLSVLTKPRLSLPET